MIETMRLMKSALVTILAVSTPAPGPERTRRPFERHHPYRDALPPSRDTYSPAPVMVPPPAPVHTPSPVPAPVEPGPRYQATGYAR